MSPLLALQQRYANTLRGHADDVESLWTRWGAGEAEALVELRQLLHRIIGTAGSYEFQRASHAAQALKDTLGVCPPRVPPPELAVMMATLRTPVPERAL